MHSNSRTFCNLSLHRDFCQGTTQAAFPKPMDLRDRSTMAKRLEFVAKRRRYSLGLTPSRRSKARRKASALLKPTDIPTFSTRLSPFERRRRASSSRKRSTKSAGVVPNSSLNRRVNCLGQRHALAAKASTDKSSCIWLSIHVASSDKREIDCV